MASPTLDMSLSELWKRVKDREAWFAAVCGVAESWTHLTEQITISENEYYLCIGRLYLFIEKCLFKCFTHF